MARLFTSITGTYSGTLPSAFNNYGGAWTMHIRVFPVGTPTANQTSILGFCDSGGGSNRGWTLLVGGASGGGTANWGGLFAGVSYLNSTEVAPANTWSSLVVTYDGANNWALYRDASQKNTGSNTPNKPLTASGDEILATSFSGIDFRIADAAAWNVVLTAGELTALANGARPKDIRPGSLVFYAPFDGIESPEPDFSGSHNNLTLSSMSLASGPPVMQFTPRWPMGSILPASAPTPILFTGGGYDSIIQNITQVAA